MGGACVSSPREEHAHARLGPPPSRPPGHARPRRADKLRVGLGEPPLSPHQLSQQQSQTHTLLIDRLSYHTHYLIHSPGSHVPSVLHTKSHTRNTSHKCTTSHTKRPSLPTHHHTHLFSPIFFTSPISYMPLSYVLHQSISSYTSTSPCDSYKHTTYQTGRIISYTSSQPLLVHSTHPTSLQHNHTLIWPYWHPPTPTQVTLTNAIILTPNTM